MGLRPGNPDDLRSFWKEYMDESRKSRIVELAKVKDGRVACLSVGRPELSWESADILSLDDDRFLAFRKSQRLADIVKVVTHMLRSHP
ncbi:hypothetical protein A3H10_00010 [Candidatus Uhrbacteria bacterium RIFCSPLOWO2_12_FULL_46_10]|uniref:Uncharacterized protein n=1 Tax=Candidatus Uhrbacteria bacterium RIFCSPLOWO2_01_FULL_47_25 TaxID=1802402 RepID=A0A1F7UTC8_9BACT|nr:MAG: hypothetical protein UX68_C0008G0026 [Parcubacteria group bacterium GW2011_GWA2_46_9]OGL60468.1 MAG: hypothetical protein A2752_05210 [Candidatus Uhrbacteria bacterium RIFCSPHIGHO2_01_FULL_46_23]OGL67842.1 MAG: hypothetical protein A3D60_01240 [Candidatus Uhrbacteria bacterium RIFCSPHIGHO2_02_FULL_47_29]OGL75510.1 MAG: hypothetical protein A3E96_03575 [Candidatus Uhrbacteria bacterium RIFCSPHIGHO2_12_FULL_46_13]OGL81541.1 MAG: hypothetical protein A2936_01730 [Candidatus Uhrbacteria bac